MKQGMNRNSSVAWAPTVSGGSAVSVASCVLLSRWLSILHPGVCVCVCCMWEILPWTRQLLESTRKHKASAKCIKIKGTDKECVIASSDGARIIWDLVEARTRPLKPFCFVPAETNSHHRDSSISLVLMKAVVLSNRAQHLQSILFIQCCKNT